MKYSATEGEREHIFQYLGISAPEVGHVKNSRDYF
jgi:hypothetical protein